MFRSEIKKCLTFVVSAVLLTPHILIAQPITAQENKSAEPSSEGPVSSKDQFQEQSAEAVEIAQKEPKKAPNVKLKEVAPIPVVASPLPDQDPNLPVTEPITKTTEETTINEVSERFIILGSEVEAGTSTRLSWSPGGSISGLSQPTPVLVINGAKPGPTLCLTGAIHGDELNGIEIIRRVIYDINPQSLAGKIIGVPIVNLQGFQRTSRYLPDRRDLNRYFPGSATGSMASRIADSLFTNVISHCSYLIDIHTGSQLRNNLLQLRANMGNPEVAAFAQQFDDISVVNSPGGIGMLRTAATAYGIPTVTLEAGESLRIQKDQIKSGVKSINGLLDQLGMYSNLFVWGEPEPVYYQSRWVRARTGGILFSEVQLGEQVSTGDTLGIIIDPITNESTDVVADSDGRIIGIAVDQVVMPGFAAYHIGITGEDDLLIDGTELPAMQDSQMPIIEEDVDIDPE